MLKKNLESEHVGQDRKNRNRFWRKAGWAFTFSVTLVALFPLGLAAQATSSDQGSGYGTGVQSPLQFAGENKPENLVNLSFGVAGFYDDNVSGTNADRAGDEALSLNSRFNVARQTEHLSLNFGYTPFFQFYRRFSQYDRLNQNANLGLDAHLSPRFILGLNDSFGYLYGGYPTLVEQPILSGSTPPTSLNQLILPYTVRTLSNVAGLSLTFDKSPRSSFALSGGYNVFTFGNQGGAGEPLYNGKGASGGFTYTYKTSEHTNFGLSLLHQDFSFQGGGSVSSYQERTQVESGIFFVNAKLSPALSVTLNGGPQYVRPFGLSTGQVGLAEGVYGDWGGSVTEEVRRTALTFSVQRNVYDGGGLYTLVINTSADFGVRRRLVGRWEADLHGGADRGDTQFSQVTNEKIDAIIGGIDFRRPVLNGSVMHISYSSMHESYQGTIAGFRGFDRNQVSIGIDFRVKAAALGQ